MDDIAIVGLACRFPGEATSEREFWDLLVQGKSAWTEFPEKRFSTSGFYHPVGERQGSVRRALP
jgi:acyl transferase domain-containing protein